LEDWTHGDRRALDRLLPLVYAELRRIAVRQLRRERAGHSLQPTALVHEGHRQRGGSGGDSMRLRIGILSLLLSGAVGALLAQQPAAVEEAETVTAPVEVDGVDLFRVRGVSSLPAAERAQRIRNQIVAVAAAPSIAVDSLRLVERPNATAIVAGETPIMLVVEADAAVDQVGRIELATTHLDRIRRAVTDYRQARSPAVLRRSVIDALVATALAGLLIAIVFWLARLVERWLTRRLQSRIHSFEIHSFEVLRAERIWASLRGTLLAIRMIAFLAIGLVYTGFVLAQFPWTRPASHDMVALALVPLRAMGTGLVNQIPSLVFLIVLFVVVRLGLRIIRLFFDGVQQGSVRLESFEPEWAGPTYKLLRLAIVAFALVVAYPYIPGSNTAAFQGISLFIGVVFSLGSSAAIANIIAGYMITYRRALKVGDRVRIGNAVGDVIDTRLQVTHLRSFKNEEIIIPNSQILAGEVLNYSSLARTHGLILHTEVGIGYETPWRQVEAMLLMAAERTDGLSKDPRPFVLEKRLGDFAVAYELNAYCRDVPAMNQLYAALHRNILDVFNEYGVQIMTPAYEGDPPEPKVVSPENWHTAPAVTSTAGRGQSATHAEGELAQ
jgi:small-conductance mechanosensitive channel